METNNSYINYRVTTVYVMFANCLRLNQGYIYTKDTKRVSQLERKVQRMFAKNNAETKTTRRNKTKSQYVEIIYLITEDTNRNRRDVKIRIQGKNIEDSETIFIRRLRTSSTATSQIRITIQDT